MLNEWKVTILVTYLSAVSAGLFSARVFELFAPNALPSFYDWPSFKQTLVEQYSSIIFWGMAVLVALVLFDLKRGRMTQARSNLSAQLLAIIVAAPPLLYFIFQIMFLIETDKSWDFNLDFMKENAGFSILNVWPYEADLFDSRWHYFKVGVVSALRVVVVSIVLCTIIGVIVGVARLSRNKLLSSISTTYVELFRNMPLIVQLFFWYTAVLLALPKLNEAIDIGGWVIISNRVVMLPAIILESRNLLLLAVVVFISFRIYLRRLDADGIDDSIEGLRRRALLWLGVLTVIGILLYFALSLDLPVLVKPSENAWGTWFYEGGTMVTIQFLGMMIGLTFYTSVQVAEIVRGSIQALPRGQVEAAISLGLNPFQRLRLVILPQALRSMIPAMNNQYLNCWKNSSLALVIGYTDFFAISQTIVNNAGQAVPVFLLILVSYQAGSLLISVGMNLLNRRVTRVKI